MNAQNSTKENENEKEKEKEKQNPFWEFLAEFFRQRVGDPLWRSYLFFFLVFNWRPFYVLFFGKTKDPEDRINSAIYYLTSGDLMSFTKLDQFIQPNNWFKVIFCILFFVIFLYYSIRISIIIYKNIKNKDFWLILLNAFIRVIPLITSVLFLILILLYLCIYYQSIRFIFIPLLETIIFIFIYLRFIKPKIVDIYVRYNGLSLESLEKEISEQKKELNDLEKNKKILNINIDLLKMYINKSFNKNSGIDYEIFSFNSLPNHERLFEGAIFPMDSDNWKVVNITRFKDYALLEKTKEAKNV